MENAIKSLEKFIELNKTIRISATDKVLFCIYRGNGTPRELMEKLNMSKGNLANYCKHLMFSNKIRREKLDGERNIKYTLTEKGNVSIQKMLANIEKVIK